VNASAPEGDEGRGKLRKAAVRRKTAIDPQISEWGNPPEVNAQVLLHESIVQQGETWGTETSKYPQEKKSTEIP